MKQWNNYLPIIFLTSVTTPTTFCAAGYLVTEPVDTWNPIWNKDGCPCIEQWLTGVGASCGGRVPTAHQTAALVGALAVDKSLQLAVRDTLYRALVGGNDTLPSVQQGGNSIQQNVLYVVDRHHHS